MGLCSVWGISHFERHQPYRRASPRLFCFAFFRWTILATLEVLANTGEADQNPLALRGEGLNMGPILNTPSVASIVMGMRDSPPSSTIKSLSA